MKSTKQRILLIAIAIAFAITGGVEILRAQPFELSSDCCGNRVYCYSAGGVMYYTSLN
jgi:hypothetical protein